MNQIPYLKKLTVTPTEYSVGISGYNTVSGCDVVIELDRDRMTEELARSPKPPSPKVFCERIRDTLRERLEKETGLEPENVNSYAPWYRSVARITLKVPPPFYEGVMAVVNSM